MTSHKESTIKNYLALMEEAKSRFFVINNTYQNEHKYPPAIVSEICYLQFRLLCEIIALGCLLVHGDIPHPKALQKAYNPTKIMKHLEKLNPHFYPQPIKHTLKDNKHELAATPNIPHLSKSDLIKLWNKSGDLLHRAPLTKLGKPPRTDVQKFSDIFEWSGKLTGLLNSHWITLTENQRGMVVSLMSKETNKASASVFNFNSPDKIEQVQTYNVLIGGHHTYFYFAWSFLSLFFGISLLKWQ